MFRYVIAAATAFCLMGGNCENGGSFQPGVGRWAQLGGSSAGQGFLAARSTYALTPLIQWERQVGTTFASPVLGPDGTIYVGNVFGDLIAFSPAGNELWRVFFGTIFADSTITGTPAVADDGSIFVLTHRQNEQEEPVSRLNKVSPAGDLQWRVSTSDITQFTSASPRVWDRFVFVAVPFRLLVFDFDGTIVAQERTAFCTAVCGEGFLSGFGNAILEGGKCLFTLGISCSYLPHVERFPGPTLPDPSVAVSDFTSVAPDGRPLVVVVDNLCMSAWRFSPPDGLEFLWGKTVYGGGCDDEPVPHCSPSIFPDGQVVIGNQKGKVRSYFGDTGELFWEYDAGDQVRGVASFGRQIHVITNGRLGPSHIHFLDSDGEFLTKFQMEGWTFTAPVLSADFAYVSNMEGLYTFSYDLFSSYTKDGTTGFASPPAIGEDGTVYVVTREGGLRAYGSSGFIQQQLDFPLVRITDPADGAEFTRLSSVRTYTVEVTDPTGGTFEGTVAISSDVDGELCSTEGSGSSFSCAGPGPSPFGAIGLLSLGTHVITATATDTQGAVGTATITIHVGPDELAPPGAGPIP